MDPRIPDLIDGLASDDADVRAQSLAALVAAGRSAAGPLVDALPGSDPAVRARMAEALAYIADPGAEETYAALLDDDAPEVRGRGAQGLAAIGAPGALDALVRTIDDIPDLLHYPSTLSAQALIAAGWPAAAKVAPLLSADDPRTRERAAFVLRSLAGDASAPAALAAALERYDPSGAEPERSAAAADVAAAITG